MHFDAGSPEGYTCCEGIFLYIPGGIMFIDSFCGIKGTALAKVCTLEPRFLCPLGSESSIMNPRGEDPGRVP